MKKIIATVLAMVMALALCTTAFAASTYTDAYKWNDTAKKWEKVDLDGASISYTNPTETKVDGKFSSGTRGYYTVTLSGAGSLHFGIELILSIGVLGMQSLSPSRRESGGAQCQSHDHGQHSCNDLLHVCFLHKNLFVSGSASSSETAFTT